MCFLVTILITLNECFSYELQVSPDFKRQGLGRVLMEQVKAIGEKYGMDKITLTVFKGLPRCTSNLLSLSDNCIDNSEAVQFYERNGCAI